jgi:potassium-transporting ATPase KdpC subunit
MWSALGPAVRMMLAMTLLTGVAYPAVVTAVANLVFPARAHGSLVIVDGRVVGSSLIAQRFTRPEYFHPRPSAAGAGYDAASSGGSNDGPTSRALDDRIAAAVALYRSENPQYSGHVPADAVTESASGLDPHISPANAWIQSDRVARSRGVPQSSVRALVDALTEHPWLGFIGEPRVNVLRLNLLLDDRFGAP